MERQHLLQALGRFPSLKVLVVGDVMLDHFIRGTTSRISPEAPVPVVEILDEHDRPGGAANVVSNLVALGANRVAICGLLGRDSEGERLKHLLIGLGADVSGLLVEERRPTTLKARVVSRSASGAPQQLLRLDREVCTQPVRSIRSALSEYIKGAAAAADAIIVSDYSKGLLEPGLVAELRQAARDCFIAVDPKTSHFSWYRGASVVTPNLREAEQASGIRIDGPESLKLAGEKLLAELDSPWLLVTQGEDGATLFAQNGSTTHIPAVAQQVFDVTGAGDTVIATFTLGVAAGLEPAEAAKLANIAAGEIVRELGTATVSAERLAHLI